MPPLHHEGGRLAPPAAPAARPRSPTSTCYVSTTFDPLLEIAINLERFGGAPTTDVLAYAPNRVADLPGERERPAAPVVYHLFGRLSASPTYVISDEDMLEFICALQSEHLAPEKLFHELEHNHLLVIGSDFSNWLARLFLRMAKRRALSDPRDVGEILADGHSLRDVRLVLVPAAGERAHPALLRRRAFVSRAAPPLEARRASAAGAEPGDAGTFPAARARDARERRVHQLCTRGPARGAETQGGPGPAGVRTWFDLDRLESGDDYDRKIRAQHRPLLLLHPGGLGDHPAAPRGLLPPRVELRGRPGARHGRRRRCSSCPFASTPRREAEAIVPEKFKAVHFARLRAGSPRANSSSA